MKRERIFVSGATGFVGRHLVSRLVGSGQPLTLAVRSAKRCPEPWRNLAHVRVLETGPIESCGQLESALDGVSSVVHLAGLAHIRQDGGNEGDVPFMKANAEATGKLAAAAVRSGVHRFIHLSSIAAISGADSDEVISDRSAAPASTPYGRSKREAEIALNSLAGNGMLQLSLRPPLVVGPDARGNWGALQRLAASGIPLPFGKVDNRRSMIGVDSLVDAIAQLCGRSWPAKDSGSYCIADRDTVSLAAAIGELRRGMGMPPRLFPFPPALMRRAAGLLNQKTRAAGLFGNLVVDPSRFFRTFGLSQSRTALEAVYQSGVLYAARSSSGPG